MPYIFRAISCASVICPVCLALAAGFYFVQKSGVNKIMTVNNSRRPVSISNERIHLPTSGMMLNDWPYPVIPVPSPVLLTHEKDEKNASIKGISQAVRTIPPSVIMITYRQRNAMTLLTMSFGIDLPLMRTLSMVFGCRLR